MNNLKSYTEYAVSTPTTDFVIGFDFNYGTDAVNVTVDDVPATEAGYSVIYLNSTTIRLSPTVPSGVVRLQRETDIDVPDNQFTAGAKFIASNMDENFTQLRHAQQEVRDGFEKLSEDTYEIIDTLQDVGQAAQDAADAAEQAAELANDAAAQVSDKVPKSATLPTYLTTAAGVDPVTGVADGAYFNVQSSSDESYIDEYQNVGGNAVATGKSYPSGSYVESIAEYTALPFKVGKSYALYERVRLSTGEIVKNVIAENTIDPNADMTGWVQTSSSGEIQDPFFGSQLSANEEFMGIDGLEHLQFNATLNDTGVSQSPSVLSAALADKNVVAKNGGHYKIAGQAEFSEQDVYLDANGATFETTGTTSRIFRIDRYGATEKTASISNGVFKQPWNPDGSSGGDNNNSPLYFGGLTNPRSHNNKFINSSLGVTFKYSIIDVNTSNISKFGMAAFNYFAGLQKQCIETIGSTNSIIVGNGADVPLLNSNAIRLTGTIAPLKFNYGTVAAANTFSGGQGDVSGSKYAASVSYQACVQGAAITAQAAIGFYTGVNVKSGTDVVNQPRGNYGQATAVNCDYAVYNEYGRSHNINITAYNYKVNAIAEVAPSTLGLPSGGNIYSGLIVAGADTTGGAIATSRNGNKFDLLVDLQESTSPSPSNIGGNSLSGTISFINTPTDVVRVLGNNSNLTLNITPTSTGSTEIALRVYGSNNVITVNTTGQIRLESGAAGNVIIGRAGRVNAIAGATNNKFIGVSPSLLGFDAGGNTAV